MSDVVDSVLKRGAYENRIASGRVNGNRLSVQARISGTKDPFPRGTPYLYVSSSGVGERTKMSSVEELDKEFDRIVDEYDLS